MGYKLRREVRDALPPALLTAGERLLVLELADVCGDDTREGWPGITKLAQLTDMSGRSIQQTLNRVGKKWIELRVPLGKNDDGRVYYAYTGKRTVYRFPPLERWEGATDQWSSDATDECPVEPTGATDRSDWCDGSVEEVRQMSAPSPQGTSLKSNTSISLSARANEADASPGVAAEPEREIDEASPESKNDNPVSRLLLEAGCPDDQIGDVREELTRKFAPRSNEWWRKVAREGDLPGLVGKVLEALKDAPEEPVPGAHLFNADSSGISCQQCGRPVQNQIHKVGNQGGGYLAQRSGTDRNQKRSTGVVRMEQALTVADNLDRQFGHGRYADQSRASPGATFGPKGYLHLHDSHSPDRDYSEPF